MRTIVLASHNRKKAREFAQLLRPHGVELQIAADFPDAPAVAETGTTFAENAALKATETARVLRAWCLADDSGLVVDALGGAPGVYSARFAGPGATDEDNNRKLIDALAGVPAAQRTARFECHLAVADPAGTQVLAVAGSCQGRIVDDHRGAEGFGYDPHFYVPEMDKTFGQLTLEQKGRISHRAQASRELIAQLPTLFGSA